MSEITTKFSPYQGGQIINAIKTIAKNNPDLTFNITDE